MSWMGISTSPQGKQLNWKCFFLLAAEPVAFVGVEGCCAFLPVSCSATVDSPKLSQQSPGDGSSLCHWDKCDLTGCETCVTLRQAGAALYTWGKSWRENSRCCCSPAVPPIYFHPQAASREGLGAALQLPFVVSPRLIPSPAVLVANLCCKPSLHISAKLAQKGTFTWQ